MKASPGQHKLKEFIDTKPALQKIFEGILYMEDKSNQESMGKNHIRKINKQMRIGNDLNISNKTK